jgi:hypothetical protein
MILELQVAKWSNQSKWLFRVKISIHLGSNFHTFGSFELDFGFAGFGFAKWAQIGQIDRFCC